MADEPTYGETTRAMANEYNDNHKESFVAVWAKIDLLISRPPVWATTVITVLTGLVCVLGTIVATCGK